MGQSNHTTKASEAKYAIHFPEEVGPGYLLVDKLATGVYGTALVVLSLRDNQLYVRKIDNLAVPRTTLFTQSAEVRLYSPHSNIPKLISSSEHNSPIPYLDRENASGVKTTTTWQFCNGGTLGALLAKQLHIAYNIPIKDDPSDTFERLPEAFIWQFLSTMLNLLIHIHERGLCHNDIHDNNIFLHWPSPTTTFPEVFLGDFGLATPYPQSSHPNRLVNTPWLVQNLSQLQPLLSSARSQTNPVHSHPSEAPMRALTHFYKQSRTDHERTLQLATDLLFNTPYTRAHHTRQIAHAASHHLPLNAYSPALIQTLADYAHVLAAHKTTTAPHTLMTQLKWLAGKIHANAKIHARAPVGKNVVHDLRPALPTRQPTVWPSVQAMGARRTWDFQVNKTGERRRDSWTLELDFGTFQVVRVRQGRGGWDVVDDDGDSDTDSESEHESDWEDNTEPDDRETHVDAPLDPANLKLSPASHRHLQMRARERILKRFHEMSPVTDGVTRGGGEANKRRRTDRNGNVEVDGVGEGMSGLRIEERTELKGKQT